MESVWREFGESSKKVRVRKGASSEAKSKGSPGASRATGVAQCPVTSSSASTSKSRKPKAPIDKNSPAYKELRKRNNEAVKKSRQKSQDIYQENRKKIEELKNEDAVLGGRIVELEKQIDEFKKIFPNDPFFPL